MLFGSSARGDAEVNLKLARLEARRQHVDVALRYYQNAIDGMWQESSDPVRNGLQHGFESAEYLIQQGRQERPRPRYWHWRQSFRPTHPEQAKLADLYLRNGDAARALSIYLTQLGVNKKDNAAILGAARASFAAGSYAAARRYLEELKSGECGIASTAASTGAHGSTRPFCPERDRKNPHRADDGSVPHRHGALSWMRRAIRAGSVPLCDQRECKGPGTVERICKMGRTAFSHDERAKVAWPG